jgi:hypothetical protein
VKPLLLKFSWGEINQRGIDMFIHVYATQEATNLKIGIIMVEETLGQVNFLFLDRPEEPLGIAVLPGFTLPGHSDLNLNV